MDAARTLSVFRRGNTDKPPLPPSSYARLAVRPTPHLDCAGCPGLAERCRSQEFMCILQHFLHISARLGVGELRGVLGDVLQLLGQLHRCAEHTGRKGHAEAGEVGRTNATTTDGAMRLKGALLDPPRMQARRSGRATTHAPVTLRTSSDIVGLPQGSRCGTRERLWICRRLITNESIKRIQARVDGKKICCDYDDLEGRLMMGTGVNKLVMVWCP